jgi:hypothetical protein
VSFAFVLSLVTPHASAADAPLSDWVKNRVEQGLLKPLRESEDSSFSRRRPPPRERRVRVSAAGPVSDKQGREFVAFAVDVRFGSDQWRENDIVGCVYRKSGELFVKNGDSYRPAAFLLGKDLKPVAGVCEAAPPPRA